MAFTATDLSIIESAIVDLATGTRTVSVSINGKTITYADADLNKLLALKSMISQSIGNVVPRAYARNCKRGSI